MNNYYDEGRASSELKGKDPIGQLFRGIEKLYSDAFVATVKQRAVYNTLIFGLYLVPHTDYCEVYKVNLTLNKPAVVFKGSENLEISDD